MKIVKYNNLYKKNLQNISIILHIPLNAYKDSFKDISYSLFKLED